MAYNGSGTYVRNFNWVNDAANNVPITASRMDSDSDGFAQALSSVIVKDGQQTATARIPFAVGISVDATSGVGMVGDLTTGMFSTGAGVVIFKSTGSTKATINSNGLDNTVIGAGTPAAGTFTTLTASSYVPSSSSAPTNGMYLPAANTLGFAVNSTGEVQLTASAFSPITSDGNALGTTALMWADLFLASGGVINFNNGNATLTHSAGLLTSNVKIVAPSFSPNTTSGIIGTTTNDNAAAGSVGEYQSSDIASGSAVSLTTGTAANLTSFSLTAGDWDVYVDFQFTGNVATTVTNLIGSIGQTSATLDTTSGAYVLQPYAAATIFNSVTPVTLKVGPTRIQLNGTTTVYGVARSAFAVNTCTVYGLMRARRRR